MYKILVLDLDDTLLKDDLSISLENIQAMKKAKDLGVLILLCSGRSDDSMYTYIDQLNIFDDHEYFISYNGAKIDRIKGETIFHKEIQQPLLKELVRYGDKNKVSVQLYYEKKMLVREINEDIKAYRALTKSEPFVCADLENQQCTTKVLFNSKDRDVLQKMKEEIEKKYNDVVHVFFSKPNYLEVLHKEANKGLAVKYLAEKLNIHRDEIIAVGDSFNDLFMIEYAGMGVAVVNGREEVKAKANYVTKKDNNHHAICEVIETFILP